MRYDIENEYAKRDSHAVKFDGILFRRSSTLKGIAIKGLLAYPPSVQFDFCSVRGILRRHRGFTLIEILIALAITSLILGALYSAFFASYRAVDAVDDSLVRVQELRNVSDILRREIESSFYEKNKPYLLFKVEDRDFYGKQASRLTFTAFSGLLPGLSLITYSADEDNGKMILKKKVMSAYAQSSNAGGFELLEEIESFTVEARYKDRWVRTWDSSLAGAAPEEVRVSIRIARKGKGRDAESYFDITENISPKIGKTI
jgi:general secretion pathway protein J